jgi:hypothetical protein
MSYNTIVTLCSSTFYVMPYVHSREFSYRRMYFSLHTSLITGFRLSERLILVDLFQLCINGILPDGIAVGAVNIHRMAGILRNQLTKFVLWSVSGGGMCVPYIVIISQFDTLRPSEFGVLL